MALTPCLFIEGLRSVSVINVRANSIQPVGVHAPYGGDGIVHVPHRSDAILPQEKDIHVCTPPSRDNSPEAGLTVDTLFSFISENPIVAKLQYGLKITFIFILILFIDSVNRVYRVQVELAAVAESGANGYVLPDRSLCSLFLSCLQNEPTLPAPHAPPYNTAER